MDRTNRDKGEVMRKFAIVLAMALALFFGAVAPTPASAATCTTANVCLYTGAAYTGSLTRYGVSNTPGVTGCKSLSGDTMNNNAESMVNGSAKFINFYDSTNCTGAILTWLHATGGAVDERSSGTDWRNRIGSFRYCGSSSPC